MTIPGDRCYSYTMSSTLTYLTRHRMAMSLHQLPPVPELPEGYVWVPWENSLVDLFAEVHYLSFRGTLDAQLFRSFSRRAGCWHVINEIRRRTDFQPEATWLIAGPGGCCASVQSLTVSLEEGSIQNVAVIPSFRRLGLGRALVLQALNSFARLGKKTATLEVTAENQAALMLYQRLGFRKMSTAYKEIHCDETVL